MARPGSIAATAEHAGGRLLVIATPIGNLGDLSARAAKALAEADLVAAEDTRRTGRLLASLGLSKRLSSLHEFNESQRIEELLTAIRRGKVVALVSDAGTPLLSDPGFALVRAAAAAGLAVQALPGPSALIAALSIAGLPTDRFVFEGFPPARMAARRTALAALARESRTLVFFEAPHRLAQTLADMAQLFGESRQAVIARELTKVHETIYRDTLEALAERARHDAHMCRGELTLIVQGAPSVARDGDSTQATDRGEPAEQPPAAGALLARALELLLPELPPARAAAIAARLAGVPRSEAYALAQRLRGR